MPRFQFSTVSRVNRTIFGSQTATNLISGDVKSVSARYWEFIKTSDRRIITSITFATNRRPCCPLLLIFVTHLLITPLNALGIHKGKVLLECFKWGCQIRKLSSFSFILYFFDIFFHDNQGQGLIIYFKLLWLKSPFSEPSFVFFFTTHGVASYILIQSVVRWISIVLKNLHAFQSWPFLTWPNCTAKNLGLIVSHHSNLSFLWTPTHFERCWFNIR